LIFGDVIIENQGMAKKYNVAIVGATGAVGQILLELLCKRDFPLGKLKLFASSQSVGKELKGHRIEALKENAFDGIDLAFFGAGSEVSKRYAEAAVQKGTIVIDKSSAFRMDPHVPLIIPEVNGEEIKKHRGIIATPNCTATIMLMALAPLHKKNKIRRIIASTYQAASGAGSLAMEELWEESRARVQGMNYTRRVFKKPYAFNVFTHDSRLHENGYVDEEIKVLEEVRKILGCKAIGLSATCVRVPTLRSHAESLNIEFDEPFSATEAETILKGTPGLLYFQGASPLDAEGKDEVLFDRLRQDLSHPNALQLWVVGDQLLKGAALNAIQIAELLVSQDAGKRAEHGKEQSQVLCK
jgi:aspartate-semialdehyde dehydrogenase